MTDGVAAFQRGVIIVDEDRDAGDRRTCRACGGVFRLTDGELAFFAHRGLAIPRRCGPCRRARRTETRAWDGARGPVVVIHDSHRPRPDRGGWHARGRR
jgi:hypothetical protein